MDFGATELRELSQLIQKFKLDVGGAPSFTALHGYLSCIVIGPGVSPARRLPHCFEINPFPVEATPEHLRLLALMRLLRASIELDCERPTSQCLLTKQV